MRSKLLVLTITVAAILTSCQRHESVTGSYGDRVLTGQVFMASDVANSSPAGVEVSVVGTGVFATLADDGRFTFVGVPPNAELSFTRSDGINARVRVSNTARALSLEVGTNSVKSKHRGSAKGDPGPHQEIEGLVVSATTDQLVVHDSHGNDVTIALTTSTLIRKGDKVVQATDLVKDDRVHVKATTVNGTLTASQVIVQDTDDEDGNGNGNGQQQQFEGLVVTAAADSLTIHDSHKNDVTFVITSSTIIRKGNATVAATDLKKDDRVHVMATTVDGKLTANLVIVQDTEDGNGNGSGATTMTANGEVKSVDTSSLVVESEPKGNVTVNVDSSTIIRKQGEQISLSGIKVGDQVNCLGTKVDDHTMTATQIEVRGVSGH